MAYCIREQRHSARLATLLRHVSSAEAAPVVPRARAAAAVSTAAEGPVITAENWRSWEEDGYMIIRNVVPPENCDAVAKDMIELLGWDLDDPTTWYTYPGGAMRGGRGSDDPSGAGGGTMLNMWQTQSQWNNRQHPRIYKAFCEIWGTDKLWCSIDTADCKPPAREDLPGWGHAGGIHCDVEQRMLRGGLAMEAPKPDAVNAPWGLRVQGNLYIDDTGEDGGGFRCVPGFHRTFNKWIEKQPQDEPLNFGLLDSYDDADFPVINISGNKGDFLLWHSFLPHSNGTNFGEKPRMCQYITMWPADLSYWPTYRTTGDTREQAPSDMLTDVPPSWMTVTADDGSHAQVDQETLAKAVYEEERQRRIKAWSERLPGGCYTWPPIELPDCRAEPQFRPKEPAKLTQLGRKLLGLDEWEGLTFGT